MANHHSIILKNTISRALLFKRRNKEFHRVQPTKKNPAFSSSKFASCHKEILFEDEKLPKFVLYYDYFSFFLRTGRRPTSTLFPSQNDFLVEFWTPDRASAISITDLGPPPWSRGRQPWNILFQISPHLLGFIPITITPHGTMPCLQDMI